MQAAVTQNVRTIVLASQTDLPSPSSYAREMRGRSILSFPTPVRFSRVNRRDSSITQVGAHFVIGKSN